MAKSVTEVARLQHGYIGPEHMILALSVVATELFERVGIKPTEVRSEVYTILGHEV